MICDVVRDREMKQDLIVWVLDSWASSNFNISALMLAWPCLSYYMVSWRTSVLSRIGSYMSYKYLIWSENHKPLGKTIFFLKKYQVDDVVDFTVSSLTSTMEAQLGAKVSSNGDRIVENFWGIRYFLIASMTRVYMAMESTQLTA